MLTKQKTNPFRLAMWYNIERYILNILTRRFPMNANHSSAGHANLPKAIKQAQTDIRFICRALCDNTIAAEIAVENTNKKAAALPDSSLTRQHIRRIAAGICLEQYHPIIPDSGQPMEIISDLTHYRIQFPADRLKDYDALADAMQKIYYCTETSEFRLLIAVLYAGVTTAECAAWYRISAETADSMLAGALRKVSTAFPAAADGRTGILPAELFEAAAVVSPPVEKKKRFSADSVRRLLQTSKGKIAVVTIFAVILMGIAAEILYFVFQHRADADMIAQPKLIYSDYYSTSGTDILPAEGYRTSEALYVDLINDMQYDFETLGLNPEGFVNSSDPVTFLQLIVTNSTSDMINLSDLDVTFADNRANMQDGKRYFTHSIFEIDERTYLIQIFAPGNYQPNEFKIDMTRRGIADSSYVLPLHLVDIDDIPGDLTVNANAFNSTVQQHDIAVFIDDDNIQDHYYVQFSGTTITQVQDNTVTADIQLILLPVGHEFSHDPKDKIQFITNQNATVTYEDNMSTYYSEYDNTNENIPPYITNIHERLTIEFDDTIADPHQAALDILSGEFLYFSNNQKVTIAAANQPAPSQ